MRPFIFSIIVGSVLGGLTILLLRLFNKAWWNIRWIRLTALVLPVAMIISIFLWFAGRSFELGFLSAVGAPVAAGLTVVMFGLILTLPLSGILNLIDRLIVRYRKKKGESKFFQPDPVRRTVLRSAAAAFPLLALSAGAGGVTASFSGVRVYRKKIAFDNLPKELEGLKILHLSDSHLGIYKFLPDWEEVLEKGAEHNPDLVLISGDIADDLNLLEEALKSAESLKPSLGVYSSLGNHEYYRGVNDVKRIFERTSVPLLINRGVDLNTNGTRIYIAGADDPRIMNRDTSGFLDKSVKMAVDPAETDSFKILMTHRPEGFVPAAKQGVNLTLAGHTHGGQVGFRGRSFFSNFMQDRYLWGLYGDSKSRLYVSSGIGHWFPFRLGCPAEAPIIELVSSKKS